MGDSSRLMMFVLERQPVSSTTRRALFTRLPRRVSPTHARAGSRGSSPRHPQPSVGGPDNPRGCRRAGLSVGDETVDQTGATTSFQLILTATARAMRGVPGIHVPGVLESGTVMVTHDRRTLSALRPVPASGVATGRRIQALRV